MGFGFALAGGGVVGAMAGFFSGWVGQQQIPFRNDRQNGKGNDRSRFPEGMTDRTATATATATAEADSLQE